MMAICLYTSRVVLNTLGVEDYGIYNVVGGVIAMFGFINGSMASATQRYITFALGKGNFGNLQKVFCTALQIHALIAFLIIIIGETVGLWFMYEQMKIPADRIDAAFWVLQCSIMSTVIMILSVPYNADIIAHEKMSAFAYISVLEVVLKLAVVYALLIFSYDKLVLYAFLILVVQIFIRFCYSRYCNKHFEESKYYWIWDKSLFKEMTSFAGWSLFGNLSSVLFGQGLNMLLNVFFGPVVNAARAIAVQAQSAIQQFVGNFQMALNPQITKTYAKGELDEMHKLMFRSARFSFYLLFFLSLPVLFETEQFLTVWLKVVPENTVIFLRIMICISLIFTLSNPLMIANQATGKIRKYQMICGSIQLMILPISYVFLKLNFPAYSVFIVHFIIELITQCIRMMLLKPLIGLTMKDYLFNVYSKVILVVALSVIIPLILHLNMDNTIMRSFLVCILSLLSVLFVAYRVGLSRKEREFIKSKLIIILQNKYRNK